MLRIVLCLLVIVLCASGNSASDGGQQTNEDPCGLSGKWKGTRGAVLSMTLDAGQIKGSYIPSPDGQGTPYTFVGVYEAETCTMGFCVAFDNRQLGNSHTSTCWTGQAYESHIRTFFTSATALDEAYESLAQYAMNSEDFVRFQ